MNPDPPTLNLKTLHAQPQPLNLQPGAEPHPLQPPHRTHVSLEREFFENFSRSPKSPVAARETDFFIDNLLVRVHRID